MLIIKKNALSLLYISYGFLWHCLPALTHPPPNHYQPPPFGRSDKGPVVPSLAAMMSVTEMAAQEPLCHDPPPPPSQRKLIQICYFIDYFITLQVQVLAGADLVSVSRHPLTSDDLCSICAPYCMITTMLFYYFTVSRFPHAPSKTSRCLSLWEPGQMWWEHRQFS